MYKIIGADGKAYGPVSLEQIRLWLSESRVNGQTQAQLEGTQEWKPLSDFAEFADLLTSTAAPTAPSLAGYQQQAPGNRDKALSDVKGPAIGILVTSIISMIAVLCNIVFIIVRPHPMSPFGTLNHNFPLWLPVLLDIFALAIYGFVCIGSLKMMRLQNYQLVFTASILVMLPCSMCCILGLAFGIWAIVVLNRPDVKSQFS